MQKNNRFILLFSFSFVWLANSAFADDSETAPTNIYEDLPIVLSPARLSQPVIDAASSVSVIDEEMIRAMGVKDVAELFRILPGFQVGYFRGNRPSVSYHGLADQFARRMQVMIDGRSIYVASYGGVPWESFPISINEIARIEVIRGPNAASYGSNAFAGVINISTHHSSEKSAPIVRARIGSHDYQYQGVEYNSKADIFDLRVNAEHTSDTGFKDIVDSRDTTLINLRADYNLSNNDALMYQMGINRGSFGLGKVDYIFDPEREQNSEYYFHHFRWEKNYSANSAFVFQYYYNNYEVLEQQVASGDLGGIYGQTDIYYDFDIISDRHDIEIQNSTASSKDLRFVYGINLRKDRAKSHGFFNRNSYLESNIFRLFSHAEWHSSKNSIINLGAMYESNDLSEETLSPKLSYNYKLNSNTAISLGVSKATRTPTFLEQLTDSYVLHDTAAGPVFEHFYLGGQNLKPEKILSREISLRWANAKSSFNIRLFDDKISDIIMTKKIASSPTTPPQIDGVVYTFVNQASARFFGIETEAHAYINSKFRIYNSFSWASASAENDSSDEDIERSLPKFSASLLAMYKVSDTSDVSMEYTYINKSDWIEKRPRDANSIKRLDIQYSTSHKISGSKINFKISLENVLGKYQDFDKDNYSEPAAGVSLTVEF